MRGVELRLETSPELKIKVMRLLHSLQNKLRERGNGWNPRSLRFRLTIGMATVSALGLGAVAIWLGWTMQRILISAHKDNILYIAERMPNDVEIYEQMYPQSQAIQEAVENLSRDHVFLWVENQQNDLIARTGGLNTPQPLPISPEEAKFPFLGTRVWSNQGRYWILCASPLVVNNQTVGELYIAQDISADQVMFLQVMRNLIVATVLAIGAITVTSGVYVARSLRPLRRICELTESISADHLDSAKIELNRAPTEVKQLAERFDEMLVRLQTAWEHQRQFVGDVSHELRTPLTIVSGYLQSIQRRGTNLSPPQREALAMATAEADRTIQLLQDLLTLARVDNGQMQFQLKTIDLDGFVAQIIDLTEQYNDSHPINYESPAVSVAVCVDENRLKQVILNLIDNAMKYSESGQTINLRVDQQGENAVLAVRDRGIGIPLSQQTRIFERFYRVDEARSSFATGGTGLGLSIVKTLVEGMGGTITVSSQLGEGTTFTVLFPIISESVDRATQRQVATRKWQ